MTRRPAPVHAPLRRRAAALATAALLLVTPWLSRCALAAEPSRAVEQALAAAQQEKKGVTLHVAGQVIAGGVVRIEAGQTVELRNPQYGRIVVRIERIDAVAMP